MAIPEEKLDHILDLSPELAASSIEQIEQNDYEIEDLPLILANIADDFRLIGQCHALSGDPEQARAAYAKAARYNRKFVDAMREHRDAIRNDLWEDAPAGYSQAMNCALVSRHDKLLTEIAAEAIELDTSYIDEFAEEYPDSVMRFFSMKMLAATILEHERFEELGGKFDRAIELSVPAEVREEKHLSSDFLFMTYSAIREGHSDVLVDTLDKFLQGRAYDVPLDTDDPEELVHDEITALCLLARDNGIDVTIDSPYVPAVLVPDPETAAHVIEVDTSS